MSKPSAIGEFLVRRERSVVAKSGKISKRFDPYAVRIQYPKKWQGAFPNKTMERSLKTHDLNTAIKRAAPYIRDWTDWLWFNEFMNGHRKGTIHKGPQLAPGSVQIVGDLKLYATKDGKNIVVSNAETGEAVKELPNKTIAHTSLSLNAKEMDLLDQLMALDQRPFDVTPDPVLDLRKPVDRDNEIMKYWIDTKGVRTKVRREAWKVYNDFRLISEGRTLETATAHDALALAMYYRDEHNNDPVTAVKKVRWLSTALKASKKIGVVCNMFEGVQVPPKPGTRVKKTKTLPFDAEESKNFWAHIPKMRVEPRDLRLLALLVATTGMRPSEACSIREEQKIDGIDCVEIGTKSPSSHRIIPLPAFLKELGFLPPKITGPVFEGAPIDDVDRYETYMKHLSNDMADYVHAVGIHHKRKRFYSLRNRAITLLAQKGCDKEVALEIVGHDESIGVHRKYIHGESAYPKKLLKEKMKFIWEDFDLSVIGTGPWYKAPGSIAEAGTQSKAA